MPKFSRDALVKLVNEDADHDVAGHRKAIEELEAQRPHEDALAEWRETAKLSVQHLHERITSGLVEDEDFMRFRLPQPPEDKARFIEHNKTYIQRIEQRRKSILDLINALVADKDGNISLTVADVRGLGLQGRY